MRARVCCRRAGRRRWRRNPDSRSPIAGRRARTSGPRSRCAGGPKRAHAQVDASHPQRAAGGRQQAAQHAEGGGLAGAVGPKQTEDFAAPDLEADMIDRGEGCRNAAPDRAPRLPSRLAPARCSAQLGRSNVMFAAGRSRPPAQQHHEAILEARRHGATLASEAGRCARLASVWPRQHEAHAPPSGTASITPGSSSSRACSPRAVWPGGGSARKVRRRPRR